MLYEIQCTCSRGAIMTTILSPISSLLVKYKSQSQLYRVNRALEVRCHKDRFFDVVMSPVVSVPVSESV